MITIEQIKANRAKWIAALKSGKYKQGKGCLRAGDAYCCLGVAANELGCEWKENIAHRGDMAIFQGQPSTCFLPVGCDIELGFGFRNGTSMEDELVKLNDEKRWNFQAIAEYIETLPIYIKE